jgi:hypothetical protein
MQKRFGAIGSFDYLAGSKSPTRQSQRYGDGA